MLNPYEVQRLRDQIRSGGEIEMVGELTLRKTVIDISPLREQAAVLTEPPFTGRFTPPDCIFGIPTDPSCLSDIAAGEITVPTKTIYELRNASIIGNSAVIADDGQVFFPDPVNTQESWRRLRILNDGNHQGFLIEDIAGSPTAVFVGARKPLRHMVCALFLHNLEPTNYGSFVYRQLPQLIFAKALDIDFDVYVVPERTSWLIEALWLAGLPEKPIFSLNEVIGDVFDQLIFCNEFDAEGFLSGSTAAALRKLISNVSWKAAKERPERIFVSRTLGRLRRPLYRPLLNENEIENYFKAQGFVMVYPETLTLAEQIRTFSSAKFIAGPSGSGMLNTVFASTGTRVLDLESFTYNVRQHAKIYASTGKAYSFLFGEIDALDPQPMWAKRWRVPLDLAAKGLDWLTS